MTANAKPRKAAAKKQVPAGAKLPEDHREKQSADDGMLRVTLRGKEWVVPKDALDDFELLDDLNALDQHSDPTRMPAVLRRLLTEQWSEVMDLLRDKDSGRVTVEAGSEFVMELITALDPNSSSS